jgi:hypothetical protein
MAATKPQLRQAIVTLATAQRLFDHAGKDLMFVSEVGWHCWDGGRWKADEAAARRRADELPRLVLRDARDCLDVASKESDPDRRDKLTAKAGVLTKWARSVRIQQGCGSGVSGCWSGGWL